MNRAQRTKLLLHLVGQGQVVGLLAAQEHVGGLGDEVVQRQQHLGGTEMGINTDS